MCDLDYTLLYFNIWYFPYGKKGIPLIGFMVVQKIPINLPLTYSLQGRDGANNLLVTYYDLVMHDDKQDAYAVSCAKMQVFADLREMTKSM